MDEDVPCGKLLVLCFTDADSVLLYKLYITYYIKHIFCDIFESQVIDYDLLVHS